MNCIMKWLPPNLQKKDIFKAINDLYCYEDGNIDKNKIIDVLPKYPLPYILRNTNGFDSKIDWFSKYEWNKLEDFTWVNNSISVANDIINNNKFVILFELYKNIYGDIDYNNFIVWSFYLNEYKGTSEVQKFIANIYPQYKMELKEWYEIDYPYNTYAFLVKGQLETGWLFYNNLKNFIALSKYLKNIESDFYAIQNNTDFCYLIADEKKLDSCFLDSPNGFKIDDVLILFMNDWETSIDLEKQPDEISFIYTKERSIFYDMWSNDFFRYDTAILDETSEKWCYQQSTKNSLGSIIQPLIYFNHNILDIINIYYFATSENWSNNITWDNNHTFYGKKGNETELPYDVKHNVSLINYKPYTDKNAYDINVETHHIKVNEKIYNNLPYFKKMQMTIINFESYSNAKVYTAEDYISSESDDSPTDIAWLDSPNDKLFISLPEN